MFRWITSKVHKTFLTDIEYLDFFIEICSAKRTFGEGVLMTDLTVKELSRASVRV